MSLACRLVLFLCALSSGVVLAADEGASPVGLWSADCTRVGKNHMTGEIDVDATGLSLTLHRFNDESCDDLLVDATVKGTYAIPGLSSTVSGASNLDVVVEEATVTPRSGMAAFGMDAMGFCGYDDWEADVPKDVTGRNCEQASMNIPVKGGTFYFLMQVHGNELRLGKLSAQHDGSAPEKRPTQLDGNMVFHRQ